MSLKENKNNSNKDLSQNSSILHNKPFIGNINDLPQKSLVQYQMLKGYRINFNSYSSIFKSLFLFHNQTVNIWSHLGGALIMAIILISSILVYQKDYHLNSTQIQTLNSIQNKQQKSINFKNLIQNFDYLNDFCHVQAQKIVQEILISELIKKTNITYSKCHPHPEQNFQNFICLIAENEINLIKNYVLLHFGQNLKKLQKIKLYWELQIIPNIVHQIQKQSNFSLLNVIKEKIYQLNKRIEHEEQNIFNNYEILNSNENSQKLTRLPLYVYLLSAIFCLSCSTLFHLFKAMSRKAYKICIGLDFAGINIFFSGGAIPACYYAMYCYINVAYFYMCIIMTIGMTLFILSLTDWFISDKFQTFRANCYIAFTLFFLIPSGHLAINQIFFDNYGDRFSFLPSLHWYVIGGTIHFTSSMIYAIRCPDRHNPGKYDLCGHSHQIFHILIFIGMIFYYFGALQNYHSRTEFSCASPI